jgi:peptidoglycan hydrolase CwlO-like protein
MSRKRKQKKERADPGGGENHPTATDFESPADEVASAGPGGSRRENPNDSVAGAQPKGIRLEADSDGGNDALSDQSAALAAEGKHREEQAVAAGPHQPYETEESSSSQSGSDSRAVGSESSGGIFRKISRWWHGPSVVTVRVPSNPPGSIRTQRPFAPPGAPPPANPTITQPTLPSGSGAERVHAVLKLEQTERELEETKRELQQEREESRARIQAVETERDQTRAELNRFFSGKGESEGHINILRKSVGALERQLQEEREAGAKNAEDSERRIQALEEALENARSPVQQLHAELEDSQSQQERLESLVERYKSELDAAQRQIPELQEELEAAQGKIRQMESELARKSGVSDTAKMERARIEERAGLVQKALDVMEQQLREEREASSKQIQQLEGERDQARAKSAQLETRVATLLRDLDSVKIQVRSKKKGQLAEADSDEGAALTTGSAGRLSSLESELATSGPLAAAEKQAATTRISRLESRWEDLKARLLPKDREITELRHQNERQRSEIEEQRSEMQQGQAEIERLQAALAAQQQPAPVSSAAVESSTSPGSGLMPLSADTVMTLYSQSMSKLTVLMASADILMMSPKLEASVRDTLQEIKSEGQALLDLIKSYTIPPDAPKSH